MASTLTLNILLGVVCLGFLLFIWAGGLPNGPEGPVGAWIVPVPFLLVLLVVMSICIMRGRFDRIPGGRVTAFLLLVGFMVATGAELLAAFERRESVLDPLRRVIPFVTLIGCFWAAGGFDSFALPRALKVMGPAILGLTSLSGWGLIGYTLVTRVQGDRKAAEREYIRDRANQDERAAKADLEFRELPADAPLRAVLKFEFAENAAVQREARARIANWPGLEDELIRILNTDSLSLPELSWTISYVADIHASPSARLAPAYAHTLDKAYRYWESTMRYDEYAAKSEPEINMLMRGAERIQKAGGDLRPQLQAWHDLLKQARGMRGLANYVQDIIRGR